MPYTPQLPPSLEKTGACPNPQAVSPMFEKPVTAVTPVTDVLQMPLSQFEQDSRLVRVRVPWLQDDMWFVPRREHVKRLVERGVDRGLIWTGGELQDLMTIQDLRGNDVQTLARIKADFGAELASVSQACETTALPVQFPEEDIDMREPLLSGESVHHETAGACPLVGEAGK